jgi:hypothetical protein
VDAADRFKGYSMGPGYWGKTFFIWPPDPRWGDGSATAPSPTSPNATNGAKDTNGRWIADWRRRFFLNRDGNAFNPQADNNSSNGSAGGAVEGINEILMNTGGGQTVAGIGSTGNPNWRINYSAVLKWIKTGPQTLPPNLRAGRILYYTSIPDDVNVTGTTQVDHDKVFWKNYIDYVLAWNNTSTAYLYGAADNWQTQSVTGNDLNQWQGPSNVWGSSLNHKPYMRYNDNPRRPRLHFWFGPLSMMDFLGKASNWLPGTCHEAQCWQLKAGMNSVIDDVRNNRPNDYVGMVLFSADHHNGPRVAIGQDYASLKNALFYPKSLLAAIRTGDTTTELRPYDINFSSINGVEIPNANGSTDPNTGLTYAFNILSPSTLTSTAATPDGYGTLKGRRGASKVVIFETDGVPNTYRGLSNGTRTMNPTRRGYDTYYPSSTWSSGNLGNGNASAQSEAVKVVQQIVKPMATAGNAQGSTADSGLSLPNAPARVYPVGFGDIFDVDLAPNADFRDTAKQFLANIAAAGNTGTAGATTIPDIQIITGPYDQRITRLKDCMERIFETGVSVALVE